MRHIQRQFNKGRFTSRIPSVWPAYNGNNLYFFDDESLKERQYRYTSNYSLSPMNIALKNVTEVDGVLSIDGDIQIETECCDETFKVSFERMAKWYSFFVDYYNLLTDRGYCGLVYTSATEYYLKEGNPKNKALLQFGPDEETYTEMDDKFNNLGGKKMFDFITSYVVPAFNIYDPEEPDSSKWVEKWNKPRLFYPDVIKWLDWFEKMSIYSTDADCSKAKSASTESCCDCTEYWERGGNKIHSKLKTWYNQVQSNLALVKSAIGGLIDAGQAACYIPNISLYISSLNSIENVGEFSIFSTEYDTETDYRTAGKWNDANINGGTIVEKDGESLILKQASGAGYKFNSMYLEKQFDNGAWDSYSDKDDVHRENLVAAGTCYAFTSKDEKIWGKNETDLKKKFIKYYDITSGLWHMNEDDGTLIPILRGELGQYKNKLVEVYRDKFTQTPYIVFGGKTIYATLVDGKYYFEFFKTEKKFTGECETRVLHKLEGSVPFDIQYNDESDNVHYYYIDDGVVVSAITSSVISGICETEDETYYTVSASTKVYHWDNMTFSEADESVVQEDGLIKVTEEPETIYPANVITGKTSSRLLTLKTAKGLVDDIGNMIDGTYQQGDANTYYQPAEGEVLDLMYQVGNSTNFAKFSDSNDSGIPFVGDIITAMTFYFKDETGNVIPESKKSAERGKALATIKASMTAIPTSVTYDDSVVWCDITYMVGATLDKDSSGYTKIKTGANSGVSYHETVRFIKKDVQYYLKRGVNGQIPTTFNSVSAHTLSYPVTVYQLEQDKYKFEYNGVEYEDAIASVSAKTFIFDWDGWTDDMANRNNWEAFPVFMESHNLGVSVPQNVSSDIYIDRGINAAIDRHLKLGEVCSLESLEQYSNGFFKMQE